MAYNKNQGRNSRPEEKDSLFKKPVAVNRITKTVKGGRKMRFSALVVVGDGKGKVGYGMGKANEVPEAMEKATAQAKKNMFAVEMVNASIPHEVIGKFGRGQIIMLPAEEGTGVIAGGPVRIIMEACGIRNIRTKSHGTNNPINMVKACIEGLKQLRSAEHIAQLRGKTVEEILS